MSASEQSADLRRAAVMIDGVAARLRPKAGELSTMSQANAVVLFVLLAGERKHVWGFEPGAKRARPVELAAFRNHRWIMFRAPAREMTALLGGTLDPAQAQSGTVKIVGNDETLYHWVTTAWALPKSVLSLRNETGH